MLSKKVFATGMEYLKVYYPELVKADFEKPIVRKVWYEALQHIDDNGFLFLINEYCKENSWPPRSPTHLLNVYHDLIDAKITQTISAINYVKKECLIYNKSQDGYTVSWIDVIERLINPLHKKIAQDYFDKKIDVIDQDTIKAYLIKGREPLAIE